MSRARFQAFGQWVRHLPARAAGRLAASLRASDPTFLIAFGPCLVVALMLFVRSPYTNYIFDEQEALLANPYVNGMDLGFFQVLERDFWGLPSDRSIGSYRPLPNVLWRCAWQLHPRLHHPWIHHLLNVLIHAANAALLGAFSFRVTRDRLVSWLTAFVFVTCAVLTEAVTGVVGLADVLGGLGIVLGLHALALPFWAMPFGVFLALTLGFFSKESTLVALPVVTWAAVVVSRRLHPARPWRLPRALLALAGAVAALVLYTEVRRHFFPVDIPDELTTPLPDTEPLYRRAQHAFLGWFAQPRLPKDPINNPLANAEASERVSLALSVYAKGLGQMLFPWTLSGDYSFPAEPVPVKLVNFTSIIGALCLLLAPLVGVAASVRAAWLEWRKKRARALCWMLAALSLVWIPVAYFPHSNIAILLPTVRAERFWYTPALGAAFGIAGLLAVVWRKGRGLPRWLRIAPLVLFLGFQALRARMHALDYTNDLVFWRATARAVPMSAKAHLNYGVMLGARNDLPGRLVENRRALELAPDWPMAHVYYADTLCRLDRVAEAWPGYARGFEMAPNDRNLIALGLQCLWDKGAVESRRKELLELAEAHRGSWLAYLARDIAYNGKKHDGVDKKYRPRGYDEGPKK